MRLIELQRRMAADIMRPLADADRVSPLVSADYVRPNDRLNATERLQIYARGYWYRLISSLREDFPGLHAVLGEHRFQSLVRAYLADCPSQSFTLRNLGSRLETWLRSNPAAAGRKAALALDMVRFEWAHIEAWDGASRPAVGAQDLLSATADLRLALQPHLRLLELQFPVDESRVRANAASNRSSARKSLFLAVYRQNLTVSHKRLTPDEHDVLQSMRDGRTVAESLYMISCKSAVRTLELGSRVRTWFMSWTELGWLCPFKPIADKSAAE